MVWNTARIQTAPKPHSPHPRAISSTYAKFEVNLTTGFHATWGVDRQQDRFLDFIERCLYVFNVIFMSFSVFYVT